MGWTSGFPEIMETLRADVSEMSCSFLICLWEVTRLMKRRSIVYRSENKINITPYGKTY